MARKAKPSEMPDISDAFGAMSLEPQKPGAPFVFMNGDQGKNGKLSTESIREKLRIHSDAVALNISEDGGKKTERDRAEAVKPDDLSHWRQISHTFPTYPGDGITVYVNEKRTVGEIKVTPSDKGKYVNIKTDIRSSENETESLSLTAVHLPKKSEEKKKIAIAEVKKQFEEGRSSDLNIVLGDFNMNKDRVQREGIDGHPAFEKGELSTNSKKNSVNIDNAYSNLKPVSKQAEDVGLSHKVGVVTYPLSK